jgi:hypothetical protein
MSGCYPSGKINENDEGATAIALGIVDNVIIINFGKEIQWIGLHKSEALEMARTLIRLSDELKETIQ